MTKKKTAAEVVEEVVQDIPENFFVVIINTGKDSDPLQLKVVDPKEAQTLATTAVERGTYTLEIDNGIKVVPVRSADVVGPFTEPAEASNDDS